MYKVHSFFLNNVYVALELGPFKMYRLAILIHYFFHFLHKKINAEFIIFSIFFRKK